jgi:hypothetical protein
MRVTGRKLVPKVERMESLVWSGYTAAQQKEIKGQALKTVNKYCTKRDVILQTQARKELAIKTNRQLYYHTYEQIGSGKNFVYL